MIATSFVLTCISAFSLFNDTFTNSDIAFALTSTLVKFLAIVILYLPSDVFIASFPSTVKLSSCNTVDSLYTVKVYSNSSPFSAFTTIGTITIELF